jgi:hypothetical protein
MKTSNRFNKSVPLFAAAFAIALAATTAATTVAADGRNALKGPLVIKEQGSFFVDGESVLVEHPIGDLSSPFADLWLLMPSATRSTAITRMFNIKSLRLRARPSDIRW